MPVPCRHHPFAAGGRPQCNEFPASGPFGIMTPSCDEADDHGRVVVKRRQHGRARRLRQVNDGVSGRYTVFRMYEDDMRIDDREVWRGGASCDLPAYREVKLSSPS